MTSVATRLTALLGLWLPGPPPVRLRAWDCSEAGPADAPLVVLRSPAALRRLLRRPGELGLAEAYIAGDLDVEGDLAEGLERAWGSVRGHGGAVRPGPADLARAALTAVRLGAVGPPPPPPGAPRARLRGTPHSTARDRAAISHHYDLSNDFYALLLDESMAYSCAYWTRPGDPAYGLADAQRDKLDLSRGDRAPGGGAFIETYIAPDMHMRPLGVTVGLLEQAGLEVRDVESLREHYARTVAAWHRTLQARWPEFTALVGEPTARVWRLYLAGSALAFAERRMGVDQILAVRPTREGGSGMPAVPRGAAAEGGGAP